MRRRKDSLSSAASIAALAFAFVAGTAAAVGPERGLPSEPGTTGQSAQVGPAVGVHFAEIPGSREFSGRVIARPLQFETLADRGLSQAQITEIIRRAKAELAAYQEHWYEPLVDHHVIWVPAGMTEQQFIAHLMATGLFEFVEPDWILYPINCPNDPRLSNQWHHNANRMQSCDAWAIHTGGPAVTVGICDTGIQTSHPDFQLHRKEGYNAVNRLWESQGGNISPVHPHGTQTTGCAAANGDNGTGVVGVGWNLSHRMMRVSNSSSGSASLSDLTHAALTSIQAGDRVANVSYSGVDSSSVRSTATQIKNLGGLLVWAAGNDGRSLNWGDRDNDDVIVVGATRSNDSIASFSARGPSMDLVAPGESVYTTTTGSGYGSVSGTSFAAPLTAGLIALIWSSNPSLTPDEVEDILKASCDDLGATGVDNTFGYGRINSHSALVLAGGQTNTPPEITINSPTDGGTYALGESVTFNSTTIDAEDGDISHLVTWTSTTDGLLGIGNFSTSSLSEGLHFIEAEVIDSGGLSDYELISITIDGNGGGVPDAPINISADEKPRNIATFLWSDESDNETGFEIERMERENGQWVNRQIIATVGANVESYSEDVGGKQMRYRVRAVNSGGASGWSAWSPLRPNRPGNIAAAVDGNDVELTWRDNSGFESGYIVIRQERAPRWNPNTTTIIATLPPNTTSFSYTAPSGEFRFRVRAITDNVQSLPSGWTRGIVFP
jgi:thermitase